MLTNFHTHTTFCDGVNTPEEMVLEAIDKGFVSLGFSSHFATPYDAEYSIRDLPGYIAEINRLKDKYESKIQIYLGVEEDILAPAERSFFDYIISSSHYISVKGKIFPVDLSYDNLKEAVDTFGGSSYDFAERYYQTFCDYIKIRKPDIVGHFDLITKYEDKFEPIFFGNTKYREISERYIKEALKSQCFLEVNTGAMIRSGKKFPYPDENLLHIINKESGKIILSSDCHSSESIDCCFEETRKMLADIGFQFVYYIYDGEFKKDLL